MLVATVGFICVASGTYRDHFAAATPPQTTSKPTQRRMIDMMADDSYFIEKGDSTIFILVGNFAAHHNGAIILADSAVRYSNQSFECFGNVLINQNTTYVYGDRASYNNDSCVATVYSDIVKIVDGEATMYTYHCNYDTALEVGEFYGGCFVEKGESLMESEKGFYNTQTHELTAVNRVEMRNETYMMHGDSVIFNTETEDARYFTNSNIWNDKDDYLYTDEGSYTKARDLHYLTRNAYLLTTEQEVWSDTIEYYRTDGHIIGRNNIQMDDTTNKFMGFADYGEWWDEPGNALFTRRPVMINYDPIQPDSLFLTADTLRIYTISALPAATSSEEQSSVADSTAHNSAMASAEGRNIEEHAITDGKAESEGAHDGVAEELPETPIGDNATTSDTTRESGEAHLPEEPKSGESAELPTAIAAEKVTHGEDATTSDIATEADTTTPAEQPDSDPTMRADTASVTTTDSTTLDTTAGDSISLTTKQIRRIAKLEERALRDSIRNIARAERDSLKAIKRAERDSIKAIKQAERDSLRYIRDSLLDIKLDSIVAKRQARNSRLADEEKARLERIKQKADERHRRKIDKAKARAARRGKEYTGEDYTLDTMATDTLGGRMPQDSVVGGRDSLAMDSLAMDSTAMDSTAMDSTAMANVIPADSVYKMVKAYRNVRMYRSDTQIACDSLVTLNTDSIIRLYLDPVLWSEQNQIVSDSMAIYTASQLITKAHFMGDPLMGTEIDTTYYNQVKGKDMVAYFADGEVCRNVVDGNAQTIYYMQDEDNPTDVTALMYIESAGITFYLDEGQMDKITYRQNPEYVLYPINMVPETQELRLPDFVWHYDKRPARDSIFDRTIRPSKREAQSTKRKPKFPITDRINYDRRRLTENGIWEDRADELTPDIIEWRESRNRNRQ